jgi:hypothetical protein
MDRSFFADPAVVTAARQFVCVRLATYEEPTEVKYLSRLIPSRSGQLENSGYCIFAPDGETKLARPGRGPRFSFSNSSELAESMEKWTKDYPAKSQEHTLPKITNVKLAITIAAADSLPLVVLQNAKLETLLNKLAWEDDFRGRFLFVIAKDADDLTVIKGARASDAMAVVQSETFGRTAEVLSRSGDSEAAMRDALNAALKTFTKEYKQQRTHTQAGRVEGVFYEPPTPVTDPMEVQARERNRKK